MLILPQNFSLDPRYGPPDVRWHLHLFGCGHIEDSLKVHTQWVRRRVSTTVRQVLTEFSEFFHLNSLVC